MDKTLQFNMRTDAETMTKLDELRRASDDLPSRGEMIRRLIHQAAAADDLPSVKEMLATPKRKPRR